MHFVFRAVVAAIVALSFGSTAIAGPKGQTTYTCSLSSKQHKAWIPEVLFIGHDPRNQRVIVSDPMVLHFNNAPVEGEVTANTARKITFSWSYNATDSRGKHARMLFRATWSKQAQKMTVTATPSGYAKHFTGRGTCEQASL